MSIHGLFIGIDAYKDERIRKLECAARDAQVLQSMFGSIGAATELLLNSRATTIAIRKAIAALARAVDDNDTAILYFSGHGAKERRRLRNSETRMVPFLLPYDAVADDLAATAFPMEEVGRFLDMIICRNVLFFFDSCYSGATVDARTFDLPGTKAIEKGAPVFPEISGEGMVILAASQEYEPAFEDRSAGHGVFTEYLIEALSGHASTGADGGVSLSSLFSYLQDRVPRKTKSLFNQEQKPIQHGTIVKDVIFPVLRESLGRTLADFPHMFLPITVVVGDRRESEPKTPGDLFALSASPAELRWILSLGLPQDTDIVPDKLFMNAGEDYLREKFGERNLLVLGSPASNLLARRINETSFFSFDIDPAVRSQLEEIHKEIALIGDNRVKLMSYGLNPGVQKGHRFYMNQLKKGGFIDPSYAFLRRGDTIPYDKDYGVVSICRNPYASQLSGEFVSILAAGVHLPGTMHALSLLSRARDKFKRRPLGGVYKVILTEIEWAKRLELATIEWSTEAYSLMDMRSSLIMLKDKLDYAQGLTEASIDERLTLLDQLMVESHAVA